MKMFLVKNRIVWLAYSLGIFAKIVITKSAVLHKKQVDMRWRIDLKDFMAHFDYI